MSRLQLRASLILLLGLLVLGCSSEGEEKLGPAQAVEAFYEHLNNADHEKALALYDAEARKVLDDPLSGSAEGFAEWVKLETKDGTIDHVEVLTERPVEESVMIEYQVRYTDGTRALHTVTLTLEDGTWKLGLIG